MYGNNEQSEAGGIQIISFARAPRKFHLDDPPDLWPGQYRVDRLWNPKGVPPTFRKSAELAWEASPAGAGIEEQLLRGRPGKASECCGPSPHSPWAADAAFLLRLPRGYAGPFPSWPATTLELLALEGRARIGERNWKRGSYTFGGKLGHCSVEEQLVLYGRSFTDARSAGG